MSFHSSKQDFSVYSVSVQIIGKVNRVGLLCLADKAHTYQGKQKCHNSKLSIHLYSFNIVKSFYFSILCFLPVSRRIAIFVTQNRAIYTKGISPKWLGLYVLLRVLQGLAIYHNSEVLASTFYVGLTKEALSDELVLLLHGFHGFRSLIRYRKFTIILIPVGKGEGNDVVARKRDVEHDAIGRNG